MADDEPEEERKPLIIKEVHPLKLVFFRRVFCRLRQDFRQKEVAQNGVNDEDDGGDAGLDTQDEIPLYAFERALVRLFRATRDTEQFDPQKYDTNQNGMVGWWEFVEIWKSRNIAIRLSLMERIYLTLEDPQSSIIAQWLSFVVLILILLSSGCFILGTLPSMQETPPDCPECAPSPYAAFERLDSVCVILFTVEFVSRFITCAFMRTEVMNLDHLLERMCDDEARSWSSPASRIMKFLCNWANHIDLAAILPFYIGMLAAGGGGNDSLVMLRLIRLTRVIRAVRLGRRFEAIIIIARSIKKSLRALYVLVFNMALGMVIFGSLMYFVELGNWDEVSRTYQRWEGQQWIADEWVNETDLVTGDVVEVLKPGYWEDIMGESPFQSIPAACWWALVTATTVGYGDHYPTTNGGKFVAALTMVWSLCVLALPIGVIGNNFGKVWEEYDQEKQLRSEIAKSELKILEKSQCFIDPLAHSRRLLVEIWHDSNMATAAASSLNHTFIGEVSLTELHLPKDESAHDCISLPLKANLSKAQRKVHGNVTIDWKWTPHGKLDEEGVYLAGKLEVQVVKAEHLQPLDWKGNLDPFCIVSCYPHSAEPDGTLRMQSERTKTIWNSCNPVWNEAFSFDFRWTEDGLEAKKKKEQHIDDSTLGKALLLANGTMTQEDPCDQIMTQLQVLPRLQDELREMKTMLADLRKIVIPAPPAPLEQQPKPPDHRPPAAAGGLGALQDPFQEPTEKSAQGQAQNGKSEFSTIMPGCVQNNH
eukprot:gnl/MRDRNA2_/MRDRNA2_35549_c0_seq1.p1 gnl/MRDRNA2_/MRDRNA2_35549_c0~~gnl/MRDRNA2_/MRDRNA2_35549_c0_seq1.p1  ORF type:complete len:761 (-),score=142.99 gnl/MRDRNA2_/MRDRNA2_35549_c0_seq1:38-2320(-)